MPINIKSQRDCLTTKVAISLPVDLNALDQLLRASKSTGHMIATYNQGGLLGVNIEQNKNLNDKVSKKIRDMADVGTKELDCK